MSLFFKFTYFSVPAPTQNNRPIKGDCVKLRLKGTFENETFEDEPELEFQCDEGEVFRGLELIVALMYCGETDEFIADPELVYGKIGLPPILPGKYLHSVINIFHQVDFE